MEKKSEKAPWGSLIAIAGLVLLGFVWPFFFFVAALVFGILNTKKTEFDDLPNVPPPPPQPRFHGTAADPDWREYYDVFMAESPAEQAFLKLMIDTHGMKPGDDALVGNGLRLDMQVSIPPYRADFVLNRTYIVEIDGAQWHSSAEAIERDRVRDAVMVSKGYKVLRIPAKVVFSMPKETLKRVDTFLGRVEGQPVTTTTRPVSRAALASSVLPAAKPISKRIDFDQLLAELEEQRKKNAAEGKDFWAELMEEKAKETSKADIKREEPAPMPDYGDIEDELAAQEAVWKKESEAKKAPPTAQ